MRNAGKRWSTWHALVHPCAVGATAWLLVLSGCKPREEKPPKAATSMGAESDGGSKLMEQPLPLKKSLFAAAGELDVENRYPAVVDVRTYDPREAGSHGRCSGVLLGPRLVLTAGHCVCPRRSLSPPGQPGKSVMDGSHCSTNPTVKTLTGEPSPPGSKGIKASVLYTYDAEAVRPHPEFKLLLNEQGHVESSKADLALILLSKPVEAKFSPPPLADTESSAGEPFVTVSFTYDEVVGGISDQRRVSRYKVDKVLAPSSDRVTFVQPGRGLFKGDSGGPCLRDSATGPLLMGVSARGLGEEPTFTSTYPYRDWLRSEIAAATTK
jgi:hypothetical protein